jgi:hypothetical protein
MKILAAVPIVNVDPGVLFAGFMLCTTLGLALPECDGVLGRDVAIFPSIFPK